MSHGSERIWLMVSCTKRLYLDDYSKRVRDTFYPSLASSMQNLSDLLLLTDVVTHELSELINVEFAVSLLS
jgi:hypothetical protein